MSGLRSFEGHMDWQYSDEQGPVDASSPFVQASQRSKIPSFAISPSKQPTARPNPFANANSMPNPTTQPQPPQSIFFNPQLQNKSSRAPPFRNTAFTTPQRRVEELASEASGAETSPGLTDASEMVVDTPEADRDDFARMTITPATAARRNMFASPSKTSPFKSAHVSGKGELPRAKVDSRQRDKIRKRKRQYGDRDVGSVRPRLNHDSDESDSDWDEDGSSWERRMGTRRRRRDPGWFSSFLTAIHDHPNAPVILSWWIQCGINFFFALMGAVLFGAMGSMVLSDYRFAAGEARSKLLAEMEACTHEYTKNRCAPKADRLPALAMVCEKWEACMNQDPNKIKSLAISSKQMALTINEFFNVLSFKAWGFILSLVIVFLLANNLGFNKFRQSMGSETKAPAAAPSQQAAPQHVFPPSHDPRQAFIWAPVTPKNLRHDLFLNEATDTDDSPTLDVKAIMPAPTPSGRRSPSKGERDRDRVYSPTKSRSPTKFF